MDIDKAVDKALNMRTGGTVGLKRKFFDKVVSEGAIPDTITLIDPNSDAETLNSVPQGDTASSRDGDDMTMKSIQIKGIVARANAADQADVPLPGTVEIMLVLDLQTNGTALTPGDVVNGVAGLLLQDVPNARRFIILGRKCITFDTPNCGTDGTNTLSTGGQIRKFKMFTKLNHRVKFRSTSDAVGSILDRSLHVIAIASTASIFTMSYTSRLRFVG